MWQSIFTHVEKLREITQDSDMTQKELLQSSGGYRNHGLALVYAMSLYANQWFPLTTQIKCSENMRAMYRVFATTIENEATGLEEDVDVVAHGSGSRNPANDTERSVMSMINALENSDSMNAFTRWTILDEMHSRLESPWMSDHVLQFLNDLNDTRIAFTLVMRAFHSQRNDLSKRDIEKFVPYEKKHSEFTKLPTTQGSVLEGAFRRIMTTSTDDGSERLVSLRTKFRHSKKKRPSKADRINTTEAGNNLRSFWEDAERALREANVLTDDSLAVLTDVNPIVSYPDIKGQTSPVSAIPTPAQASASAFVPLESAQPRDYVARRVPRTLIEMQAEARQRAAPVNVTLPAPEDAPQPEEERERSKIKLPAADYNTIQILLGTSNEARPGEIAWGDIVSLVNEIGFTGPHRHPGSARYFRPSDELKKTQVSNHTAIICNFEPDSVTIGEASPVFGPERLLTCL